jgi:membrane-associated phospholipid phosphatase
MLGPIILFQIASAPYGLAAPESGANPPPAAAQQRTAAPKAAAEDAERSEHRLNWTFPRFRLWQYVSSGAVTGLNLYLQYGTGAFPDSSWNSPILFDEPARDALVAGTQAGRDRAAMVSDYMWHATQYYTIVVDSILVPLATDRLNADVAWQMSMVNWQAIGLSFFLTRLSHVSVGRSRPSQHGCSNEPGAAFPCEAQGPSFLSGHTSMAATGTGLACAHHMALPLYGGGWPDTAICVVLATSTVTLGTLRVVSDKHWASDVLIGGLIGGGVGFGLPYFLHYTRAGPLGAGLLPPNMAFVPLVNQDVLGIGIAGSL